MCVCVCVCVFIKACVHTSSICQAAIIANRTEVLKNEHSHGWNQQQHNEHHYPDISAEGLWEQKKKEKEITNEECTWIWNYILNAITVCVYIALT